MAYNNPFAHIITKPIGIYITKAGNERYSGAQRNQ